MLFLDSPDVLNARELTRMRELASSLQFIDGTATNRGIRSKNNLQIDQNDPETQEPGLLVRAALFRSVALQEFAFPKILARPTLSKYQPGMKYGRHVDAPLFPSQPSPMRSDLSCTVFISEPEDYEGGELVIHLGDHTCEFKCPAGHALVYASTTVHEVRPVTAGERLVAISWMQSYIPDASHRETLVRLQNVINSEHRTMSAESLMELEAAKANLYRMWATV